MSIVSGSPPSAPASMGGLSSAVEDVSTGMSSLRFDGSSYLSRRLTATGNQKVWTFSCWVKRSELSTLRYIFSFGSNGGGNNGIACLAFDAGNSFYAYFDSSGSNPYGAVSTTHLMRDTSAFYHIVWQVDASTSSADYWVNSQKVQNPGVQPPDYTYGNIAGWDMVIGTEAWGPSVPYLSGYLANIHFIDGQALDANSFGEKISDIWKPRPYTGDFGANGFHLDFHPDNMVYDINGKLVTVMDASSNNNHWQAH